MTGLETDRTGPGPRAHGTPRRVRSLLLTCMDLFGIRLLGVSTATGHKLLLTLMLLLTLALLALAIGAAIDALTAADGRRARIRF